MTSMVPSSLVARLLYTKTLHSIKNSNPGPLRCRTAAGPPRRCFGVTSIRHERASTTKYNNGAENPGSKDRSKAARAPKRGKTSLRRVAVEAERSRGGRGHGEKVTEHDGEGKVVTAYCAAEQFKIAEAARILEGVGYVLDPSQTGLYPQVLHIQSSNTTSEIDEGKTSLGDIFVFPSGTIVAWAVEEETIKNLVSRGLLPAAESPQLKDIEEEDLQYFEDSSSVKSRAAGDKIDIGTKINPEILSDDASTEEQRLQQHETNLVLAKIAFSSGLARSVKLAVLENALEAYFQSTKSIPDLMAAGGKIPFTRRFIIRKTGELMKLRAQLNLNSELTDSLPDMFWDSRHELGLESYFEQVGRALDVNVRSRVLNQKMDYAQEIVSVLREQLSERHGLTLEWLIIGLITIEVLFEIHRVANDHWPTSKDKSHAMKADFRE